MRASGAGTGQKKNHSPRRTALDSMFPAAGGRVDLNTIRAWLGHVSLNTTNIYAEIDLETKAKAMALCDATTPEPGRSWKEDKGLIAFLKSL